MDQINFPGIGIIKVRHGANIKFLSIRMAPGRGIWVNIPYGVSGKTVENFILEKKEWIIKNIQNVNTYEQNTSFDLSIGSEIKTKLHTVKITTTDKSKIEFTHTDKIISIAFPANTTSTAIRKATEKILLYVYQMECETYLPQRVKAFAERCGFQFAKLSFRNNISNWGSCSFDNNISLNIKLMKLPDHLIDYVILHELCHTIEKNHSDDFWNLVGSVCPDYQKCRQELRTYNTRI